MENTDAQAEQFLAEAMQSADDYYKQRGIFQDRFGFGKKPAIIVVDFANGWTDEAYAGGTARLDGPVENTAKLLAAARPKNVPIVYTTSPWRPDAPDKPFKSAADFSADFRDWDENACQIDDRLKPAPADYVIEKESASAFFATHLVGFLTQHHIDTVLITGCSTSACIRATATDAKSYRYQPIIISDCVGDRSAAAHVFTLFDIQARFSDVKSLDDTLSYLAEL
jgi:nicotinamidase-related amidase